MRIIYVISYYFYYLFKKKNNNLIIFTAALNEHFNQNTKYLFKYYLEHSEVCCKFIINNDELRNALINEYGNHFITNIEKADIKLILSAQTWVTSVGLPLRVPFFHVGRQTVNVWHGIPLKKVIYNDYGISPLKRLLFSYIYPHYSLVTATSPLVGDILQESFRCSSQSIQVLGQPWDDALFEEADTSKLFPFAPGMNSESKAVLYAPTWRTGAKPKRTLKNLFQTYASVNDRPQTWFFPFDDFDVDDLQKKLEKENTYIFIRAHALDMDATKELVTHPNIVSLDQASCPDIMTMLNLFDLLITDYSSIYLDFLLLKRPMIFLPYDLEEYLQNPGLNLDYDSVTPGPKPNSYSMFVEELFSLLRNNTYREEIEQVKSTFHTYESGNCQRIFEYIEEKRKGKLC